MKILSKSIIVLMIVFSLFYKSNVSAESTWIEKSGHLYQLTDTQTDFISTVKYNTTTGQSSLIYSSSDSYKSFDNTTSTKATTPSIVSVVYGSVQWTDPIKLKTVTSSVYQNHNSNSIKTRELYGINQDGSTTLLGTKTNPLDSGNQTLNETWTITNTSEFYGIAIKIFENYQGRYIYLWELQVTEWQEYFVDEPVDPDPTTPTDFTEVLAKLDSIDQNIKNNGSLTLSLVTLVSLFGLTILNIRWFGGWKK